MFINVTKQYNIKVVLLCNIAFCTQLDFIVYFSFKNNEKLSFSSFLEDVNSIQRCKRVEAYYSLTGFKLRRCLATGPRGILEVVVNSGFGPFCQSQEAGKIKLHIPEFYCSRQIPPLFEHMTVCWSELQ